MNGIAGVIHPGSAPVMACPPRHMVERMCHDAHSFHGYATFERIGLHVGWVCARTAAPRAVPAWSSTGQVGVILTGGRDDESNVALANAFEKQGIRSFRQPSGWFSGVVIDRRDDTVTLFNDRYGLGRIYYHESAHGFFFASEAKALLAAVPSLRRIDPRGLAEVFSVGCVLQNRTLFPEIHLLPPSAAWTFGGDGRVRRQRYFDPAEWEQQPALSAEEYGERLRDVFSRAASRVCLGAPRVGLSLTGGLDSRAVIAWTRAEPGELPCYTFGGPYRDCADVRIARRLAILCRHPHTTIRIGGEFFAAFPRLAEEAVYLSDGAMDVSGAVELHVNRKAREIAPVRLTGNYGSEILRSHVAFRPGALDRTLFTPEFNRWLDAAAATYRDEAACHRLTFIAFKQIPWHHFARFAIEKSQLTPRSPFLDPELVALAYQAPESLRTSPRPLLRLIAQGNPRLAAIGTDRALRATSVPVVTRLASSWQEFTARAEYVYDYGMPRWLAGADRALMRLRLERLFLGRHKFYHFRVWYRDQFSRFVREQGGNFGAEPFCFKTGAAWRIAAEHLSGRVNRTLELHRLLTLQLTERTLLRAP